MIQKKIALFFGGVSSEHQISIRSSYFIFNTIDRQLYDVVPVYIDQTGKFWMGSGKNPVFPNPDDLSIAEFFTEFKEKNAIHSPVELVTLTQIGFKAVFLGLHGGMGEDGRIQGFLDVLQIPYTGSSVLASALAMDKYRSNILFKSAGIPVAPFIEINKQKHDPRKEILSLPFTFPVFIKPTLGGSSVNTGPAKTPEEAMLFIDKILVTEDRVFVQELIKGTEVSIGVLEKDIKDKWVSFPLVPTEIRPKSEFFDFAAKYQKGGSEEITPAELISEVTKTLQNYALICHDILGCKGYSRTDFIIRDNIPYVLETNTLPGMTGTSLIPQQAKALGIDMKDVFTWLLKNALS
ncbi:D-alanine--D-alanine ligase [Leptospira sp. 96542]|nr:D-alanine--D-alanine ligase [Leptospira sp. 96542]